MLYQTWQLPPKGKRGSRRRTPDVSVPSLHDTDDQLGCERLTLTLSAPARILPQETASSGLAPESDPSYCPSAHSPIDASETSDTHLLACIDVHGVVRTVSLCRSQCRALLVTREGDTDEEHSIGNLMFTHPSTQNDHPGLFRLDAHII